MKCKDCVHYVICSADNYFKEIENVEKYCCHFKKETKKGHWEICCDGYYPYCSECMYEPERKTNFCPNCGCDMRGEK